MTSFLPSMLCVLESLTLDTEELAELENFHPKNLRFIQHLPQSTANPAVYLLLGAPPVEAHLRAHTLFGSIISHPNPSNVITSVVTRQLAMKGHNSSSWTTYIKTLCIKYALPSPCGLSQDPPNKKAWKKQIRSAIFDFWTAKLRKEAAEKKSLAMINLEKCKLRSMHNVWKNLPNTLDVQKATVKVKLMVMRYPLPTSPLAKRLPTCPLCSKEDETTTHILLTCEATDKCRQPYLPAILENCRTNNIDINLDNITNYIFDNSNLPAKDQKFEITSRNLIYKLHHCRTVLLGGMSQYATGSGKKQ